MPVPAPLCALNNLATCTQLLSLTRGGSVLSQSALAESTHAGLVWYEQPCAYDCALTGSLQSVGGRGRLL